jgi:hypothetical protein
VEFERGRKEEGEVSPLQTKRVLGKLARQQNILTGETTKRSSQSCSDAHLCGRS